MYGYDNTNERLSTSLNSSKVIPNVSIIPLISLSHSNEKKKRLVNNKWEAEIRLNANEL